MRLLSADYSRRLRTGNPQCRIQTKPTAIERKSRGEIGERRPSAWSFRRAERQREEPATAGPGRRRGQQDSSQRTLAENVALGAQWHECGLIMGRGMGMGHVLKVSEKKTEALVLKKMVRI